MLLLWLFCFSPGSTGNGVQTSRKQSLLKSNNPTTLCIDSRFFSSVCCCDIFYIYIWFNYVTFEHLLVICRSLLVVANRQAKKQMICFLLFLFKTNFLYRHYLGLWFLAAHLVDYFVFSLISYEYTHNSEHYVQNITQKTENK